MKAKCLVCGFETTAADQLWAHLDGCPPKPSLWKRLFHPRRSQVVASVDYREER